MTQVPPSPDLPDDTKIHDVSFPTRIVMILNKGGFLTIGEIRETSDTNLLSYPGLGRARVAYLRKTLGVANG
jgi:DNA-directed RNA polymerase alpha subunit